MDIGFSRCSETERIRNKPISAGFKIGQYVIRLHVFLFSAQQQKPMPPLKRLQEYLAW